MQQLEKTLKALANRRRLAILALLKQRKDGAVVTDISEELDFSYKATSKHLAILRAANLVHDERQKFEVCYSIAADQPEAGRCILAPL